MNHAARMSLRAALIGALSGALVFFALNAVKAQQSLTARDVHANPKQYVGSRVAVTGLASGIRAGTKWFNGQNVPCIKLNLYFHSVPNEGDTMTITGTLKWPYQFAMIDE